VVDTATTTGDEVERWFIHRGTPHFIDDYSATRDVFTRALPALTLVFLFELAGALNADWRWWQNVLAAGGGLLLLIGTWIVANRARGMPALQRPARVGRTELTIFVLAPALVPLVFGGQIRQAVLVAAANLVLLGTIYLVTSWALVPLTRWATGAMLRQVGAVFGLLVRALPMLLLVDTFLFVNPDVWQAAAALEGPFLAATVVLFLLLGSGFLFTRLPHEIDALATFRAEEDLRELCAGTPGAPWAARAGEAALRPWPLGRRQRGNVALVVVVSEAIQVVLVALVIGLFFVVFGLIVIRPPVLAQWVGNGVPIRDPLLTVELGGHTVLLTAELLRVAGFLAAFSGFYFTVYVITDATYRREFFEEVIADVRQALAVRAVYLAVIRERGGHGAGRSAATPSCD
jgi:hypothetical protein